MVQLAMARSSRNGSVPSALVSDPQSAGVAEVDGSGTHAPDVSTPLAAEPRRSSSRRVLLPPPFLLARDQLPLGVSLSEAFHHLNKEPGLQLLSTRDPLTGLEAEEEGWRGTARSPESDEQDRRIQVSERRVRCLCRWETFEAYCSPDNCVSPEGSFSNGAPWALRCCRIHRIPWALEGPVPARVSPGEGARSGVTPPRQRQRFSAPASFPTQRAWREAERQHRCLTRSTEQLG